MHESHKLQALGCDVGQGYLYAKPMAKAQLVAAMRRRLAGGPPPVPMPARRLSGLIPGLGKASRRIVRVSHAAIPHL